MGEIIGRKDEQQLLKKSFETSASEFIAIYGRRRIGKTYLIAKYSRQFKNAIFFHVTGIKDGHINQQINQFSTEVGNKFYESAALQTPENWLAALRIWESGEDDFNKTGDNGLSWGAYQIQEGRWNDALDRIGIAHDDPEWRWDLWYWNRAKAEYVLYSYWARFDLKTWEQRIKAHKGIKEINNPSRVVYYQRVKNIAYDLMRRKVGG